MCVWFCSLCVGWVFGTVVETQASYILRSLTFPLILCRRTFPATSRATSLFVYVRGSQRLLPSPCPPASSQLAYLSSRDGHPLLPRSHATLSNLLETKGTIHEPLAKVRSLVRTLFFQLEQVSQTINFDPSLPLAMLLIIQPFDCHGNS